MGVSGLWDILRPTGEVHSLTHLAVHSGFVENFEHRAYRIGIDASIWFFHAQGGREGENPELRTLFFRCSRLLAMPFLPIFVFDGPKRPKIKRGRAVGGKEHWMVNNLRAVLDAFGFECRTAPGEAEAELAYLNRVGVIDAVLSDDVDCFLFGAHTVIRNSSATLSGNRGHATRNTDGKEDGQHAYIYHLKDIESHRAVNLSPGGLILIALLRGGDYDQQGVNGCGIATAHALARAGYGDTLLAAARSSKPGALAAFLPTWRTAIRHELRTNNSGLAPRKSPTLAQRITDDFPRLDVLRCYTHPITSESEGMGMRGLNALWSNQADVAKIAHVCEMYFEWGVEATVIKRFRSFLWPGAVLRHLLHAALVKDKRDRNHVGTPSKRSMGGVGTPSKALARAFGGITLDAESEDDDDTNLVVAIRGERRHASTDETLEYRLEIDPRELVARARTGIQGLRQELADSAAADALDEDDEDGEEDEDEKKKKRNPKTPPPDPDSKLRVWMPAVVVEHACPGLTRNYVEQKTAKESKKESKKAKGVKTTKWRKIKRQDDEEEEEESTPAKHVKSRTMKESSKTTKAKMSYASADTSESDSPIGKSRSKTGNSRKVAVVPVRPILTASSSNPQPSQSVMAPQLLDDDDPFLAATMNIHPKIKTNPAKRPQPGTQPSSTSSNSSLNLRPFLMFTAPSHRSPAIPARTRKYSSSSTSSGDIEIPRESYKKSPRKSTEHTSPRKPSRMASPSPQRPIHAPQMRPLHRAMARSATSKSDDEVIVISSDTDDAQFKIKTSAKPPHATCRFKKTNIVSSRLDQDSDVIDLTSP